MKNLLGLLVSVIMFCSCNAQVYRIQKAQAFFTVSVPGMQRVDDNGNPVNAQPNTERFIYLECRFNGKPKIDAVSYNEILFTASIADKKETILKIGIKKENGNPVVLSPKKGNAIWKIYLQQTTGKILPHDAAKRITIKGKLDKVKFSTVITAETELTTPDMY